MIRPNLSQNDMGRAFEYSVASAMATRLKTTFTISAPLLEAEACYKRCPDTEWKKMRRAAETISDFIFAHDARLSGDGFDITIQADKAGKNGDVRDILISNKFKRLEIGVSAKNRHKAVKHSRLSESIDFGKEWVGVPCSPQYFQTVTPIFQELRTLKDQGMNWKDIPDKSQRYYLPILQAFQVEMLSLFNTQPQQVAHELMRYLLGRHDFYKITKENGTVSAYSYNMNGTLGWGNKLSLSKNIIQFDMKSDSETTLLMILDKGWQISFRIHNASTIVEPSLKFDVTLIGIPSNISKHDIHY